MNNTSTTNRKEEQSDPLQVLAVFDQLEVGPLRLERRRLIAPYRLSQGEKVEQTDLIYTYEEVVFDPSSPESKNLAAIIAAQVALNYALFCRRIVFHDWFDKTDRRFLRDMAEKTAREIYVKKFLEPNLFCLCGYRRNQRRGCRPSHRNTQ